MKTYIFGFFILYAMILSQCYSTNKSLSYKQNEDNKGSISLSNYKWEWKPYVKQLKEKHLEFWTTPSDYYILGIISGQSIVKFEIDKTGNLIELELIEHKGDTQLEESSLNSIKSIFPFLPLPIDYPDSTLIIRATLIYPDLQKLPKRR